MKGCRAQYGNNIEFQWLRDQLDILKTGIEVRVDPAGDQRKQLAQAIRMLREHRHAEQEFKRTLLYELLLTVYENRWSADRLTYLEKALAAVKLRYDYFLSFTTRHPGGINSINMKYCHFIQKNIAK